MDVDMAPPEDQDALPSADASRYLIHHVILPRKVPQSSDYNVAHEELLLKTTLKALHDLKSVVRNEHLSNVDSAIAAINYSMQSRDCEGNVSEVQLHTLLNGLVQGTQDNTLPLEIKAQNAGILVSRKSDDVTFEFFELAPLNEASMNQGRLVRNFPGLATSIPLLKMKENNLLQSLSRTISKMSAQAVPGFQPQTIKAGHSHDETRDTTHCGMVTDCLMNITAAVGRTSQLTHITKHTREEVSWNGKLLPWRRSPLWLLIRVTLQLHFTRKCSSFSSPDTLYKIFMAFLVTRIVDLATLRLNNLDRDLMHAAQSKLLWRYNKIESLHQTEGLKFTWAKKIITTFEKAHSRIDSSWQSTVEGYDTTIRLDKLSALRPQDDFDLKLASLDKFLAGVADRQPIAPNNSFAPASTHQDLPAKELPQDVKAYSDDSSFNLLAVEKWVEDHLESWIQAHSQESSTCRALLRLIKSYHTIAKVAYAKIPARMSVMYLTLLELWAACDRSACSNISPLCKYHPGIDLESAQCLLLPFKSQMIRLANIESYLAARIEKVSADVPLVDQSFGHESSIAVEYFDQSATLQAEKIKIEQAATAAQQRKIEEFMQLKQQYQKLVRQYEAMHCNEVVFRGKSRHRSSHCKRCKVKSAAERLSVDVFEWPLSSQPSVAKATVFETFIPEAFAAWRDTCAYIEQNVLEFREETEEKPSTQYTLSTHPGLSGCLSPDHEEQRVILLSEVKPHRGTHFNVKQNMSTLSEQDLCPNNGLKYRYYDRVRGAFCKVRDSSDAVSKKCTYRLPKSSKKLNSYLHKPPSAPDGTPPNEVIAKLSDCPPSFSLDEYKAFGTLASGRNLLYSNILLQLAMPSVDFAKVETHCLVLQLLNQAGPPAEGCIERTTHRILTDASFCKSLLEQVEIAFKRVAENWESWRASAALVQIACRVISLTTSGEIVHRCLVFLSTVRQTCLRWLLDLKQRAGCSSNDAGRTEHYSRATEISLLCTSTFDVEDRYLHNVLQPQDAISTLLQCSIMIQQNCNLISETEHLFATLTATWKVLMHRLAPKLRQRIATNGTELNRVIFSFWSGFQASSVAMWTAMSQPHEQWVRTTSSSLPIHFNLLTAELLVNGLPLSRLPANYMAHPLYKALFGGSTLEVGPSEEAGMYFSSKYAYQGYQLNFGMSGSEMSICVVNDTLRYVCATVQIQGPTPNS